MYTNVTSYVQINGHFHGPIPIHRGVRLGCPLTMALFRMCVHPFLTMLKQLLPGVQIGRDSEPASVLAYADDVTVFLTSTTDLQIVKDIIQQFKKASGARLNTKKSRILSIGRWPATDNILDIPHCNHVKILGFHFWGTLRQTISASWNHLVGMIKS
jgi:hypothetical protein